MGKVPERVRLPPPPPYSLAEKWDKNARKMAAEGAQSVRTVSGRKRWLPEGEEAEWPRFTALVNTPGQGGAADALKQAMVDLADKMPPTASIVST